MALSLPEKRAAFFNVGDPITFGKYQNKPGRIVRFLDDGKGNPLIEIEPDPKGLKRNKVMPLFRIRHRVAPKVAARYLSQLAVREAMTRSAADDIQAILLKLRKGVTKPIESIRGLKVVLDYLGGWILEPCVGLVLLKHFSIFSGNQESASEVYEIAKRHSVSSLPTTPQVDELYIRDLKEPAARGNSFVVRFEAFVGAAGFRIVAPNGKTFEVLPRKERFISNRMDGDLRRELPKLGKKPQAKNISRFEYLEWLRSETGFHQQVLDALGMEAHEKAQPRTQENTGSCPACFRNIKLKRASGQAHPSLVNHGYRRPGWGSQVGNCFGVGYPPFELSPRGTEHLVKDQLRPALEKQQDYMKELEKDSVMSLAYLRETIERSDPRWANALSIAKRSTQQMISFLEEDIKVLEQLISSWKQQPLPEAGKPSRNWKKLEDRQASSSVALNVTCQFVASRL